MENKEFKQLKDEELNEVNGGATIKQSEVRLDEEYKTTIKYTAIKDSTRLYNESLANPVAVQVLGKEVKSQRPFRDFAVNLPVIGFVFRAFFSDDYK